MKFNVGDLVTVKPRDECPDRDDGPGYIKEMDGCKGRVFTISEVMYDDYFLVEGGGYAWLDTWLIPAPHENV